MTYQYDREFFDFVNASSGKSAGLFLARLVSSVLDGQRPQSVLDVGCGRGVWLSEWLRIGAKQVVGLDGAYVDVGSLLIPSDTFTATDISRPFDLEKRFQIVECLEVAEHIPAEHAETLIDNLVRHGDLVLFSAATPGQGGEFHVNERPYEYWREKFAARGYSVFDAIRPLVAEIRDIEPWYRYNAFVFANSEGVARLSPSARATIVAHDRKLPDVSPLIWRARCAMIRSLPAPVTSVMARLKHRAANLVR